MADDRHALCIVGEARSLPLPCVHRSLRERLIDPLAARFPKRVSLLMLLRRQNAAPFVASWRQGRPPSDELNKLNLPSSAFEP